MSQPFHVLCCPIEILIVFTISLENDEFDEIQSTTSYYETSTSNYFESTSEGRDAGCIPYNSFITHRT